MSSWKCLKLLNVWSNAKCTCNVSLFVNELLRSIFVIGNDYILLASSSQDSYVRLWKISSSEKTEKENTGVAVAGQFFECNRKGNCLKLAVVFFQD